MRLRGMCDRTSWGMRRTWDLQKIDLTGYKFKWIIHYVYSWTIRRLLSRIKRMNSLTLSRIVDTVRWWSMEKAGISQTEESKLTALRTANFWVRCHGQRHQMNQIGSPKMQSRDQHVRRFLASESVPDILLDRELLHHSFSPVLESWIRLHRLSGKSFHSNY